MPFLSPTFPLLFPIPVPLSRVRQNSGNIIQYLTNLQEFLDTDLDFPTHSMDHDPAEGWYLNPIDKRDRSTYLINLHLN